MKYVAITPARDEAEFLPRLIRSMARQTVRADRWIIIDDGSADATSAIADAAQSRFRWIEVHHLPRRGPRAPGGESVIMQFLPNSAWVSDDHILRLDADLSFEADFITSLLREFERDPRLGIAGPTLCEPARSGWRDIVSPSYHTRGAAKMYSRACFAAIGGLDEGLGWDTLDEAHAMMLGFRTRSFTHIKAMHHRPQGAATRWRARIAAGVSAYKVGYSPAFLLVRAIRGSLSSPFPIAGALLLGGYLRARLRGEPRTAPPELIKFVRQQQRRRLLFMESVWR